jgi:hypothetical protein
MRAPLPRWGKPPAPVPPSAAKITRLALGTRSPIEVGSPDQVCTRDSRWKGQHGARCREIGPVGISARHHNLGTIFPAMAVSHFRPETRQTRRSKRGFLRPSSERARQCQALKTGQHRLRASGQRRSDQPSGCRRTGGTTATAVQCGAAPARVPDARRGRHTDLHGQETGPLRPPGCDHGPDRTSARLAGRRTMRADLGSG